ncbi:MAG TPA: glycosyltransferase [Solirubrobacterales bacterium]|nr:glycosyltransferase [Solirubrobacterales bacterium]
MSKGAADAVQAAGRSMNGATPAVSVIVPTRAEAGNVGPLVARLDRVLSDLPLEVIFVDDSDDDTPDAIRAIESTRAVYLIHRPPGERQGGLGGAVVAGMRHARAPFVCVMDADLQHPPEVLEEMYLEALGTASDMVVASRFCAGGDTGTFGRLRAALSRVSTRAAMLLFPKSLWHVSDPMSGCFIVRRQAVDLERLRPRGFKILLEILVRTPGLTVSEVPFGFGERHAGETKASVREALRYVGQLARLELGQLTARFGKFTVVGATGLVVNTLLLALLADVAGLYYVAAAILATQGSTLWNFCLTEGWVFAGREHGRSRGRRAAMFFAMNNAALALRVPLLYALTTGLGMHYLVSNILSLAALTVIRFGVADAWIWAKAQRREVSSFSYDIHGIVTVTSEVRLPELHRFMVPEVLSRPTIRVRIGHLRGQNNGHVSHNGNGHRHNGHHLNGNGANGNGAGADAEVEHGFPELGHVKARTLRYTEGMGGFGFGVEISQVGERVEVLAAPLLQRSPHVLYTNVVEPILRWTFASKGYALVHAACFADGDHAFMVTARTDTGKTTTTLKLLDHFPYSFLSDDLTIVCPDGRVLAYPKPLTISRHTVHAVKTPLLSRRERIKLVPQSRLHSRSGRRFAMVLAAMRIPAATLNAVVQRMIPPPKYDIDRLIPTARVAPEAKIAGLVIIQREGDYEVQMETDEALAILRENCEDAFGFPPYSKIEEFLQGMNGHDLKVAERDIVTSAFGSVPATLIASSTMDWWQRLPTVMGSPIC